MATDKSMFEVIQQYDGKHPWTHIIIHHSLTKDGKVNDWEGIRKWHTGESGVKDVNSPDYNYYCLNPMKDIGYHFGLEQEDGVMKYRIGRSLDMDGGHTKGMNSKGIGICCVGDYDHEYPDYKHYYLLGCLCRELMMKFDIPLLNVEPHSKYAQKTCPGRFFNFTELKQYISRGG